MDVLLIEGGHERCPRGVCRRIAECENQFRNAGLDKRMQEKQLSPPRSAAARSRRDTAPQRITRTVEHLTLVLDVIEHDRQPFPLMDDEAATNAG